MALVGDARAQAVYTALSTTNPNFGQMTAAEQAALLASLKVVYGADTTYLKANAVVQPTAFSVPLGINVSTTGTAAAQTGSTTSAGSVTGTGTLS